MAHSLRDEIHQTAPFQSSEEELYLTMLRTTDKVQRQFSMLFKRFDLTHTQYNVLRILRGAGPSGLLTGEVMSRLLTQDPDVTRLLERMVQRGLVERTRSESDRRCVRAVLTPEGLALVNSLDVPLAALLKRQFSGLSDSARRSLLRSLNDLRDTDLSADL